MCQQNVKCLLLTEQNYAWIIHSAESFWRCDTSTRGLIVLSTTTTAVQIARECVQMYKPFYTKHFLFSAVCLYFLTYLSSIYRKILYVFYFFSRG